MTWSVRHDPGAPYMEGIFTGVTTWQDMQDMTAQCIAIQMAHGVTRFLIDTSDMQPLATFTDVLKLPAREYDQQHADRTSRIAVIYSPSGASRDIVQFYETACVNRGWQARSFTDRREAIAWLRHETER
jgi:hypothetical protein